MLKSLNGQNNCFRDNILEWKLKSQEEKMNKIKEAIEQLEDLKIHCEYVQNIDECTDHTLHIKAIDTAVEVLGNMPVGKWIEKKKRAPFFEDIYEVSYDCGCCGYKVYGQYNYCPNCGAKMDLED